MPCNYGTIYEQLAKEELVSGIILQACSDYYAIPVDVITSATRKTNPSLCRKVAAHLMDIIIDGITDRRIAKYIGRTCHSTAIYLIEESKSFCKLYKDYKIDFDNITNIVNGKVTEKSAA